MYIAIGIVIGREEGHKLRVRFEKGVLDWRR
jgi:hypothetical protein